MQKVYSEDFHFTSPIAYHQDDEIKDEGMGRVCGTLFVSWDIPAGFRWGSLKKKATWRPRHRCEGTIKMGRNDIGWGGLSSVNLAQDGDN